MPELVANEYLNWFLTFLIYLSSALIMLGIGRWAFKLFNRSIHVRNELLEKDNLAFAFLYVGYYLGIILSVGSAIVGPSHGILRDLSAIGAYGLLAIILLNLSSWVTDKILLRKFSVRKEVLEDRNPGTGILEGANYVAAGLIIFGSITGESENMLFGFYTAVGYWVLGQILLVIAGYVYQKATKYDIHEHIEKDNVAVALGFAGALVGIANLVRHGLMGEFDTWIDTLIEVGFEAGIGLIAIPLVRTIVDRILLPGRSLTDELINQEKPNVGAGLIEATAYVGGSVLITWCL